MSPVPPSGKKSKDSSAFLFPETKSKVLPDPSCFFSPHLLSAPLPTNSFFQNMVLRNGDQPEYIHPYLIKSSPSGLSLCYPSRFSNDSLVYQIFKADLTISAKIKANPNGTNKPHIVSSFSDLSVTLDIPNSNLRFFLVRGSPFLTCAVNGGAGVSMSTTGDILSFSSNTSQTKYIVTLKNNQAWLIYSSSPINLSHRGSQITSGIFSGVIRIAVLLELRHEAILDQYSSCYPISGEAQFSVPFRLDYRWDKLGCGDLLMLAHPLHLRLLSTENSKITVLNDFRIRSIDGELVGVVGHSWSLKSDPISVTWLSIRGITEEAIPGTITALCKDVEALNAATISTTSSYFYGKLIARAARLVLIAEEVSFPDVIPKLREYLKASIEPWLDGSFQGNGFLYDKKWGGIVTKQGSVDSAADFGFGLFGDHHCHLGYFVYAIAVLVRIDPAWGRKYRPQAYSLMADFMNLKGHVESHYPRLRCFDLWKLHSWGVGLTEFADGRSQENTGEAVNGYYSAALMGLAYGDPELVAIGSTLAAMEIGAAKTWWQVKEDDDVYEKDFTRKNRTVGVLWANKRDSGLWFAPREWKECRLGIQVLPLSPITEVLFSDIGFVRQLVKWALPALHREGVGEGWKEFVYALEGVYDKEGALKKIRNLNGHDNGNSLTNTLWWIHSRGGMGNEEGSYVGGGKHGWYGYYYH